MSFKVWAICFLVATSVLPPLTAHAAREPLPDWAYVQKRLKAAKLPAGFIADMKKIYNYDNFLKVLELNTLAYLRSTDYHGPQVSGDATKEVRDFVGKNRGTFNVIEKRYGVPPHTISALLYIETRHGANKGYFHVASVYMHILQADRPAVARYLKARIPHYTSKPPPKIAAEIGRRTKRKAAWALDELVALHKIYKQDRALVKNLKGSFSGAFGMAQFIPTSYVRLAKPFKKGHAPDLTRADDSITSVAHYLHASGWRKGKKKSFKRALMKYNNSEDYAKAILSLAERARTRGTEGGRGLSSAGSGQGSKGAAGAKGSRGPKGGQTSPVPKKRKKQKK